MITVVAAVALLAAALWLRIRPTRRARLGGVDAWFYLLYAEALRRQRRLPARLENYLLDIEEQWYPPLFALLLACFPAATRVRVKDWVAPVIDVAHMTVSMAVAAALGAPPVGILLAGAVYAVMPAIVMEFSTLNSRSLGSLLFTLTFLFAAAQLASPGWAAFATTVAGALLVITHKMATQLYVPLIVALAVTSARVDLAVAGALSFAVAWVITGGVYTRVFRGHVAILRFWRTHLGNLNAHQVYDSPLYARAAREDMRSARRFFTPGLAGAWRLARVIVAGNPFVIVLPWLLVAAPPTPLLRTLAAWVVVSYVMVLATTFIPALRFLGEGPKYLKFAAFPQAVLVAVGAAQGLPALVTAAVVAVGLGVIWRLRKARNLEVIDDDLARAIDVIRADPRPRVATIPCHYCDVLAYFTDKQVLWGAHSAGYEKLEEWFPVIRTPVETVLAKYDVDLLLVDRQYVDPDHLRLGPKFRPILELPRLVLFARSPSWAG